MSISSEITRLQNAKASIKTSIENKGVTVPSATKLDGYSTLIDSIQTGGGGWTKEGLMNGTEPNGDLVLPNDYAWDTTRKANIFRYSLITSITYGGTNTTAYAGGRNNPFQGCTAQSISCPNLTLIGWQMFNDCTSCTVFYLPNVTNINRGGLSNCNSCINLVLPKCTNIDDYAISSTSLKKLDVLGGFFKVNSMNGCSVMDVLVIRSDTITTLNNISAFNNTPFASGKSGGTLYVPADLISSYQSATNWSTILGYANNSIKSIESTHTDPSAPIDLTLYYADGTPIS